MHVISLFSMLFCLNLYCDGLKVLFTLKFLLLQNDLFHFTGCEYSLLCVMDSLVIQINTYERILVYSFPQYLAAGFINAVYCPVEIITVCMASASAEILREAVLAFLLQRGDLPANYRR